MAYLTDQNDRMSVCLSVCLSVTVLKLHMKRIKKKKRTLEEEKKRDEERGKETKTLSLMRRFHLSREAEALKKH